MNKSEFDKKVNDYLGNNYNPGEPGLHNYRGRLVPHRHILSISQGNSQLDTIKAYNLIPEAKEKPFINTFKIHPDGHYLNSSQIMCYNFFSPLIEDTGKPSELLIKLFQAFCPTLGNSDEAKCVFEYVQNGEPTNFDFYLSSDDCEVFCEIKYSERNFSKSGGGSDPHNQYETIYRPMIESTKELWKGAISENAIMNDCFQLFRNALRAVDVNHYVMFICPNDRTDLYKSYSNFRNKYMKDTVKNVMFVTWESLIEQLNTLGYFPEEFSKKYFGYK